MGQEVRKIEQSRVVTFHGTNDETIPASDAEAFSKAIANHELHLINEADHNFTKEIHLKNVVDTTIQIITRE